MIDYHDTRWCKPEHREQELFAMLILEGAQAGLSWATILAKEATYRTLFAGFDPSVVAAFDESDIASLLGNPGIVRNRRKIAAAVTNARAFLAVQAEFGSFDRYIWGFTGQKVIDHHLISLAMMPAKNDLSTSISKDLKKRGFSFVGPTIVYSYLQAIGIINDHLEDCPFR